MNKLTGLACLMVGFVGVVSGCGGDAEVGRRYSSGLGGKVISELTEAEAKQICEGVSRYFLQDESFGRAQCQFAGIGMAITAALFNPSLTDAELRQQCKEIESICLQTEPTPDASNCESPEPGAAPAQPCTATVAELEVCVNDSIDAVAGALSQLPTCDTFKRTDIGTPTSGGSGVNTLPTPGSCTAIEQKCPGVVERSGVPQPEDEDF